MYISITYRDWRSCQLNNIHRHKPLTTPWRHFSLDFVTDLPTSEDEQGNKYDSIFLLVDRFTKYVRCLAVTSAITAQGVADVHGCDFESCCQLFSTRVQE